MTTSITRRPSANRNHGIDGKWETPIVTMKPLIVDSVTAGKMLGNISKSTVEKLTRERATTGFPPIRKVSANRAGYLVSELEAWAAMRPISDLLPPPNSGHRIQSE